MGSSDPYNLLTTEEKRVYDKQKLKEQKKAFKWHLAVDKMPVNKPHFGKKVKLATEED